MNMTFISQQTRLGGKLLKTLTALLITCVIVVPQHCP